MWSTLIHLTQKICAPSVVKTITLLTSVVEIMVFLIIILPEEEEETKVALAEGTQEEKEASFAYIVVSLTTLQMSVTESMVTLLDTSLKVQTSSVEKEEGDNSTQERNPEAQNEDVKLTSQQYKALMALLQQQNTIYI